MELSVRSQAAAAAVVVTAGSWIVTAHAVSPSLPDVQVPNVELTADLADIPGSQTQALYDFINHELNGTTNVVQSQIDLDHTPFNGDSILNGAGDRAAEIHDLLQGYQSDSLTSVMGTDFHAADVISGVGGAGFGAGAGLAGIDQNSALAANAASAAAIFLSNIPNELAALQAAKQNFDDTLIQHELAFNQQLVASETNAEQHLSNGVLSGVANQFFSAHNMLIGHEENALNSLLGANSAADASQLHDSLLLPSAADSLHGLFSFSPGEWSDLFGTTASQWGDLFNATDANFFSDVVANLDWASLFTHLSP